MIKKHVFRIFSVVTVTSIGLLGLGLAHAGDIDVLVEKADDLIEHADASIEASDGIAESLDAIVEEVDAMVEDAIAEEGVSIGDCPVPAPGSYCFVFTDEAMMHADELTEASDGIAEANIALLQEVYDVLLDSDAKVDAALELFDGTETGVAKRARIKLEYADVLLKAALGTVCATFVDDADAPCIAGNQDHYVCDDPDNGAVYTVHEPMGAIEKAMVADAFIECADFAIEASIDAGNPLGAEGDTDPGTLWAADAAIEAADAKVEASDAAIEAADAAIEAADKAVEKADRLVEAAGL